MTLLFHARRTGVPLARAEELWRQSLCHATEATGWVGGPEYWQAANAHLLAALDAEHRRLAVPPVTQLLRTQQRIGRLPLQALEAITDALRHTRAA